MSKKKIFKVVAVSMSLILACGVFVNKDVISSKAE
jgi:hypothetical protein